MSKTKINDPGAHHAGSGALIRRFLPYLAKYKKTLFLDLFCAALTTLCDIVLPKIMSTITNAAMGVGITLTAGIVLRLAALYFVLRIIDGAASYYMSSIGHIMGVHIETDMRRDAFDHLLKLDHTYYNNTKVGTIMGRITNDLFDVTEFAHHCPEEFFIAAIKIVVSFIILCRASVPLTLAVFACVPLMGVVSVYLNGRLRARFRQQRVQIGELNSTIEDSLLGQGVVARFDAETYSDAVAFARIGEGSLGGKARGLAFMNSMLMKHRQYDKHENVRIMIPRSVVIATEFFDDFIRHNGLKYIISQDFSDEEILSEFVSSVLPFRLREALKSYIRTVRTPLAIRSSSKLEDSHYQPFAGIYSTYMIPYVDNEDQMLRLLLKAVKSVYASVYFAASRAYIQSSQNLISEEKMAVIIQEVCGTEQDGLYFPTCSGVARSINYYPIGDERPEDGVCNIAMGLGKLVVDGGRTLRFSPRYPQKVLQTSTPELALRDTQNEVLALDLRPEAFRTSTDDAVNIRRLTLREVAPMRQTRFVASVWDRENDRISDSPMDEGRKVITFNAILKYNTFPLADIVRDILRLGVEEMRCPVEVEFAVNMDVPYGQQRIFNLLQIRPIIDNNDNRALDWRRVPTDDALIYARNALGVGNMNDIRDIVYVKPERFDSLSTQAIAGELDALNARMREAGRGYILVGPGRWGSSDPFLGIPVKWQQITEARVIVECGLERFRVEPSQGTHFFQNVTSLGVGYLTINPFMGDGRFDAERLGAMPAAEEGEYLRRVSFPAPLWVYIDGRSNKGIVRTEPPAGEE